MTVIHVLIHFSVSNQKVKAGGDSDRDTRIDKIVISMPSECSLYSH